MALGNALNLQFTTNQLIYGTSPTTLGALVTGINGVLITSAGGIPSISSTLPIAVQTNITELGVVTIGTWNASIITGTYGGTGINNGASTFTIGGNVAFAGAFTFTGTLTGNTAVIFPTSGTLATVAGASGIVNPGLINQLAYYAGAGSTVSGLTIVNSASLVTSLAGLPTWLGPLTNGQIIIGSTGAIPVATTITAGTGVTITNGAGSISVSVTGGAAVTSVTGTANRITSTGGTTPVIDISAAYVGQASITTLGTITTGVWNGSIIPLAFGGTNAALVASNGGIVWTNATQMQILAGTATALQMLQSGAGITPTWSTSTWPATTTVNQLLYSSALNTVTGLATATNGLLVTSAAGVPSILAGPGTTGQILQANAAASPSFSTASYPSTTTINQLLYSSAANTVTGLATAISAHLVSTSTGVPVWTASMTNGQIVIGSTGATPVPATLIAGTGIGITNGAGSITITNLEGGTGNANMVVNGDYQIWQRGAGGSAVIAQAASLTLYTTDRWQLLTNANQASTVTQAAGTTSGSFNAAVQRNNAQTGTGVMRFCTSLTRDMCVGSAGSPITLTFSAQSGANFSPASGNITVTVYSGTGSTDKSGINGAFTGSATPISQTQAITNVMTQYTFTSGNLGATVTQLAVEFSWTPVGTAGAADTVTFKNIKLEQGSTSSAFIYPTFQQELFACLRFYWKSFLYGTAPATGVGVLTGELQFSATRAAALISVSPQFYFPVPLIKTPTITTFNPTSANAQVRDETAPADCSLTATFNNTANAVSITCTGNAASALADVFGVHLTAEAELI